MIDDIPLMQVAAMEDCSFKMKIYLLFFWEFFFESEGCLIFMWEFFLHFQWFVDDLNIKSRILPFLFPDLKKWVVLHWGLMGKKDCREARRGGRWWGNWSYFVSNLLLLRWVICFEEYGDNTQAVHRGEDLGNRRWPFWPGIPFIASSSFAPFTSTSASL